MKPAINHAAAAADGLDQVHYLATVALRHALDTRNSGTGLGNEFGARIRRLCADARDLGLHAEDVIIMIKRSWRSLSEVETLEHREAESMLNDIVTHCISEFYR